MTSENVDVLRKKVSTSALKKRIIHSCKYTKLSSLLDNFIWVLTWCTMAPYIVNLGQTYIEKKNLSIYDCMELVLITLVSRWNNYFHEFFMHILDN